MASLFTASAPMSTPFQGQHPHHRSLCLSSTRRVVSPSLALTSSSSERSERETPNWTGDTLLSRTVNAAISFAPLFSLMKMGARAAIKGGAEERNVPWDANVTTLKRCEAVYRIKDEIEDASMEYPSYYTQPFHGYDEGNLNWLAAFEVEPATDAMALRVWKQNKEITPLEAQNRLRRGIFDEIRDFASLHSLSQSRKDVLDIGCSTGYSTRWLAAEFPEANVLGLDLSPYFLAVAELRERQRETDGMSAVPFAGPDNEGNRSRKRIKYIHANMESTGLEPSSFDLIAVQFVIHELPTQPITNLIAECRRLLRPGGIIALADNDPRSKVIQGLPPVLFTLMKSTEPWSDQYYAYDVEGALEAAGFKGVVAKQSDPRHRVVLGYVPQ